MKEGFLPILNIEVPPRNLVIKWRPKPKPRTSKQKEEKKPVEDAKEPDGDGSDDEDPESSWMAAVEDMLADDDLPDSDEEGGAGLVDDDQLATEAALEQERILASKKAITKETGLDQRLGSLLAAHGMTASSPGMDREALTRKSLGDIALMREFETAAAQMSGSAATAPEGA